MAYNIKLTNLSNGAKYTISNNWNSEQGAINMLKQLRLRKVRTGKEITEQADKYYCYRDKGVEYMCNIEPERAAIPTHDFLQQLGMYNNIM